MKKEYKEIYDLVNSLGYSPSYIRFKNGVFSLAVYPLNYDMFKDRFFNFQDMDLKGLKETITEELKQEIKKNE